VKKNLGFTLTETLVAIVIGTISIVAAFSAYNYFNKSYTSVSQKSAINKSAREALSLIARDLRNAGYIDPNFIKSSWEGIRDQTRVEKQMIGVLQKYNGSSGTGGRYNQADQLEIWYTISPFERKNVTYFILKYRDGSDNFFLMREIRIFGKSTVYPSTDVIVSNVEDFQVILKDKDGNIIVPVCTQIWGRCGPTEISQGANQQQGNMVKGQANQKLVHTADVYLTVRSPKEVYSKPRRTKIQNGESPHGSNITINADKYHRETFFVSVHTRNLATPQVKIASSGQSVGIGTGYNK
tara:strand:+ start:397 stop:1284 length:888 start_codon:yes stop_codon:yes gene_type:complete